MYDGIEDTQTLLWDVFNKSLEYLATGTSYFVNDVGKDNILIIGLCTDLFPLWVLSQSHIISEERMTNAKGKNQTKLVTVIGGTNFWLDKQHYLVGYLSVGSVYFIENICKNYSSVHSM